MSETPEGSGAETLPTPEPQPDTGKETNPEVEKWKALARKHEERAKENAEAARKVQQLEDSQKSEQQRLEDRASAAERERDAMKADALRYKVAAKHGLTGDDADFLQGVTDEDKLTDLATRLTDMRKAAAKQTPAQPTPSKPKENLRPGATPSDHKSEDDLVYEQLFGAK